MKQNWDMWVRDLNMKKQEMMGLTNQKEAVSFVKETGIDCLAADCSELRMEYIKGNRIWNLAPCQN